MTSSVPIPRQLVLAIFAFALANILAGCAARTPHQPSTPAVRHPDYVDLQPGWRVRMVTPLTRSGKYKVETQAVQASGNTIEMKASDDLLGYQEDFYEVRPAGAGIVIRFKSATAHMVDGQLARHHEPKLPLLQLPESMYHIRLLFLTRESPADYDGAILAARSVADIDSLTRQVEEDPAHACVTSEQSICRWIPLGISVQPQPNRTRK